MLFGMTSGLGKAVTPDGDGTFAGGRGAELRTISAKLGDVAWCTLTHLANWESVSSALLSL